MPKYAATVVPATEKQVAFAKKLLSELAPLNPTLHATIRDNMNAEWTAGTPDKATMSRFIDNLLEAKRQAEANRPAAPATRQPQTALPDVPAGRYAVLGNDGTVDFYQVDRPTEGKWAGYTFVTLLIGSIGSWAEQRIGREQSATILGRIVAAGVEESARLFGRKTKVCGHCLSPLSKLESRASGYGRTCAGNHGYWYASEAEAREILDEAEIREIEGETA